MTQSNTDPSLLLLDNKEQYLTLRICNVMFGIPVTKVRDIFDQQKITFVPLAAPEILGEINLRGRIGTAIDMRRRLSFPKSKDEYPATMNIAVELHNELYSLVVDSVGEVMTLLNKDLEPLPVTLDQEWKDLAVGIFKLKNELLIILDIEKILNLNK